jgi:hypothetical protein
MALLNLVYRDHLFPRAAYAHAFEVLLTSTIRVSVSTARKRARRVAAGDSLLKAGANLLMFGGQGVGKSHLAAAIGRGLVENGWRVLYTHTTDLVQRLQVSRRDLVLESAPATPFAARRRTMIARFDFPVRDPVRLLGMVVGPQVAVWTLAPALVNSAPPLDVVEGYMLGREWVLATAASVRR